MKKSPKKPTRARGRLAQLSKVSRLRCRWLGQKRQPVQEVQDAP